MARLAGSRTDSASTDVALPRGDQLGEGGPVGLGHPVPREHPGQQRVFLRQCLSGRHRGDQPESLIGRGGIGQAVGFGQEHPGLVQDDRVVPAERLQRGNGLVRGGTAQRRQLMQPADSGLDGLRFVSRLAALGARRVHRGQEFRLSRLGGVDRRVVRRQVGRRRPEQVGHRGGPLVLHEPDEFSRRQRGRVDQVGRPVQVDGVVDGGAGHIGEQPDHGEEWDRREKVNPEPYGSTTRSHGTPTFQRRECGCSP